MKIYMMCQVWKCDCDPKNKYHVIESFTNKEEAEKLMNRYRKHENDVIGYTIVEY